MHRKLIIGWILLLAGILLQVISDMADVWIIGVLGGIVWPVGMVIGANAAKSIDRKKHEKDSFKDSHMPELDKEKGQGDRKSGDSSVVPGENE